MARKTTAQGAGGTRDTAARSAAPGDRRTAKPAAPAPSTGSRPASEAATPAGGAGNGARRAAAPRGTGHPRPKPRDPNGAWPDSRRAAVEAVRPNVDGGRYPVKRALGETLEVEADAIVDGHDTPAVLLRHRKRGTSRWTETRMQARGNDVYSASFELAEFGEYEYTVDAWVDRFETWRHALQKKVDAAQDVMSELVEGAALLRAFAEHADAAARTQLVHEAGRMAGPAPQPERVNAALEVALAMTMARVDPRDGKVSHEPVLRVRVERGRARFGAWYEMFPRSAGDVPSRGATLREAAARLSEISEMGFDVVYLPPVHPIGTTHRKGPNNSLRSGPGDPGSPWAIGSKDGGHKAVHPDLGKLEDFSRFVAEADELGLEIAMDLAFQCSPDHPYVREHPEWFRHRPDGTIKYAENPPKKYQDIYPLDFECADWRRLWDELKSVVTFWAQRGVRIFRVDNPHTKPFRFWEWMIAEVQREYPDVIFLAEAFTRPKVMQTLAKRGFTQSYTYFTWRNTKHELTEYFTHLSRTDVREYMRPNLFANTPDILHEYLQFGGRPAFQTRLVLAATLGATYGIYGPAFELCEARAVPGSEEYKDSEKYQVRAWDRARPGHIRDFITRVNEARRANPALHFDHRLRFHEIGSDQLIAYSKSTADLTNVVLVVVNLDPHHAHDGWLHLPLEDLGIDPAEPYQVHDVLADARYLWQGDRNYVRLDPHVCPAHLFVVRRRVHSEKDFDYYQ